VLDALSQGVLIFDDQGRLAICNRSAETLLGPHDLKLIRVEGWTAAAVLLNSGQQDAGSLDAVRKTALDSQEAQRFRFYRHGEFIPCWVASVCSKSDALYTMITLENPDWSIANDLVDLFHDQVAEAVDATEGHIRLIDGSMDRMAADATVGDLRKRIGGFSRLIATHMYRTGNLMDLMDRMHRMRTGDLRRAIQQQRTRLMLLDFLEDFLEDLDTITLLDPETDQEDYRARLFLEVPDDLEVLAAPNHLAIILRDMVRNAIMYSMKATPVTISASTDGKLVQIDVIDEGYGVRAKEIDKVFQPFLRARQPQIIAEFGHGLSLYLCKQEIEAMGGAMWFTTEEQVGSIFSIKLPRGDSSSPSVP
jgi:nitrogen-specific signal transduction histidine kinase